MRSITAILILAAAPAFSQTDGMLTGRKLSTIESGDSGFVREYDGSKYNPMEGAFDITGAGKFSYFDIGVQGLGNGEESGYFNLNLGSFLSVKSGGNILHHRLAFARKPVIINGQTVTKFDRRVDIALSLIPLATDYAKDAYLGIKRVAGEAQVALARPSNPDGKLLLGVWQETETGTFSPRYPNQVDCSTVAEVNRYTRDIYAGINTPIGKGAVSADVTQRTFKDDSDYWVSLTSYSVTGGYLYDARTSNPQEPDSKTMLYDVRFRSSPMAPLAFTGALSARTRTSDHNDYIGRSYAANLGGTFKPTKKLYVTFKAYGRAQGIHENDSNDFRDDMGRAWTGLAGTPEQQINHYNVIGDLRARYRFSDKLSFNAGYKYSNTYRKWAEHYTQEFANDATYEDGTFVSSYTQTNGTPVRDIKKIASAGFAAELPFHAELEARYQKTTADFAAFESLPTDQDLIDVSLDIPVFHNLTLMTAASYLGEKNTKSNLTDSTLHQNSYQGGLEWNNSWISAGTDYAYEQASYRSTGWFGQSNSTTTAYPRGGSTQFLSNMFHVPGMLFRYENNVYGYHATVKLSGGISLIGRGSYTISRAAIPVNFKTWRDSTTAVLTNLAPMDVRIMRGSVGLKFANAADTLSARLTYRRDVYTDRVLASNSGLIKVMDTAVSLKF